MATPFYTLETVENTVVLVLKGHPRSFGRPLVYMCAHSANPKPETLAKMEAYGRKMAEKNNWEYK